MNQNTTESSGAVETLADVPEHVLKGLPEEVRLFPSAVDKTRLGVWATKSILKGKKFGPFLGDKKKRSQVKSNVYMWEVYYPNLGWMCVDATDPKKGNWLRYVNWARSGKEQNLFPLEINRTIYYKTLKPIEPGQELLVWYNGEDNAEIAAALEEERAQHRSKRHSPKAKKGKKKAQEGKNKGKKATDTKQNKTDLDFTSIDMKDSKDGHKEEDEKPSVSAVLSLEQTAVIQEMVNQDALPKLVIPSLTSEQQIMSEEKSEAITSDDLEEEEEEDEDDEDEEEMEDAAMSIGSGGKESLLCEEKLDSPEEQRSMSEDSPESSPKKTPVVKIPKVRGESNGDLQETFMFPCQHCERKFTTKQGLERHMHIHISTVHHAFKCRYCGKAFGTQINRRRHERRHEAGPKRKPFLTLASSQQSENIADNQILVDDGLKDELNVSNLAQDSAILDPEKVSQEMSNCAFVEENKEPKELHPCKYCKKVFGTHTNMRRHQRRVHERHLIPKGVRRKGYFIEEPQLQTEQAQPAQNVYIANTELEEEGEADDVYIMDISSNISENLNYYIDVVSSVVSPADNLETPLPIIAFKQEEMESEHEKPREDPQTSSEAGVVQETFNKSFVCNVCDSPFLSIKDLTKHLSVHAEEWPFKCEFCVQLFRDKMDLSEHRFLLHGVGNIFVCSVCKKEFAFLCNLQQHQRDLHPDKECTHHEFESGTLRPQNFTDPTKANIEHMQSLPEDSLELSKEEEDEDLNDSSEELYTTIKIMASGVKSKDPDVRMGLNQHYPSFKPPPFQYHHRNPMGIGTTATNFTTHNIPQTFTTAIRCTKCGKSVDNMPELHKHILACASASDKKRYTPKKNPVPLKQTVQPKNGVVVIAGTGKNAFRRMGQPKRLNFNVEISKMSSSKLKLSALKKKNQLVQKAILQKKKSAQQKADLKNSASESDSHICPYCNREFTYIGSLNKHASYSCPKKPVSPSSKRSSSKKAGSSSSLASSDKGNNQRRRTADAEIKMQSMQAHLGKTRARTSGPTQIQLPSASFKSKQNVKFISPLRSKKPNSSSSLRNSSPMRVSKMTHAEGKKTKAVAKNSSGISSKASRKLHVRLQRNKAVLPNKSAVASKKKADRFSVKYRERIGGPVTRSLQQAANADTIESKRDESAKQELKDFRNLL
ncbi:PR domain zinc finger protein 2 [Alligator mississippiensis]|uniref:PR domain zinc finger protein 2 n=1 Tax=Alligator mississippiensis TaxID=8496 RepID=A0A151M7J2_ALLMI|nr:PR domain zinc finger protein 2 [Alligator mississippiensis]